MTKDTLSLHLLRNKLFNLLLRSATKCKLLSYLKEYDDDNDDDYEDDGSLFAGKQGNISN